MNSKRVHKCRGTGAEEVELVVWFERLEKENLINDDVSGDKSRRARRPGPSGLSLPLSLAPPFPLLALSTSTTATGIEGTRSCSRC